MRAAMLLNHFFSVLAQRRTRLALLGNGFGHHAGFVDQGGLPCLPQWLNQAVQVLAIQHFQMDAVFCGNPGLEAFPLALGVLFVVGEVHGVAFGAKPISGVS